MKAKLFLLFLIFCLLFSACKKQDTSPSSAPYHSKTAGKQNEVKKIPEPEKDPYETMALNPLSGEYIDEEKAQRRPVAIMINNLPKALPQSGIGQADIIYEMLAEGGITRLLAVFQNFNAEKIGPVRSARNYYLYPVLDLDAIYVHHGGSPTGYQMISKQNIEHMDGMNAEGFWRDSERVKKAGMYEHSSYTSAENIEAFWREKDFRKEKDTSVQNPFLFYHDNMPIPNGTPAVHVIFTYSPYQESEFFYEEKTGLYTRYQNGSPHIDELTGEVLQAKNIILQYADTYVVDKEGRIDIDLIGENTGLYFTEGTSEEIKWKKNASSSTVFLRADNSRLLLNPGKTWVIVLPPDRKVTIEGGETQNEQ